MVLIISIYYDGVTDMSWTIRPKRLLTSLAQCVERRTSTREARVQIRISTQRIYSRANRVLWHKEDSNRACVMHSCFLNYLTALECIAAILDNTKYLYGPL
jgi:hypothetical protein